MAPLFMMIGLAEGEPGAIAFGLLFAFLLTAIGHFFFSRSYRKNAEQAKEIFDELEQIVIDEGSPTIEEEAGEEKARIDLDAGEGYESEEVPGISQDRHRKKSSSRRIP